MKTLEQLCKEFMAALDHAMYLSYKRTAWTDKTIGTPKQCAEAWAKYHDIRNELNMRLNYIERSERTIAMSPALSAPYEGVEQHDDPYQTMAFAIFRDAHTED